MWPGLPRPSTSTTGDVVLTQDFVTTGEAAARLGVTPNRIRQLIRGGQMPAQKVGRDWMILEEDLESFQNQPLGKPRSPRRLGR